MDRTGSTYRAPYADDNAYTLLEVFMDMGLAASGAVRAWWRRMEERQRVARLRDETRHLSEHLLKDIGLWDQLR